MKNRCRNCGALTDIPDFHGATLIKCPACEWQEVIPPRKRLPKKLDNLAGTAYSAHREHEHLAARAFERVETFTPPRFERFCAELCEQAGYTVLPADPASTGTHELELRRGTDLTLAACRRVAETHALPQEEFENLAGAMRHAGGAAGLFITTGVIPPAGAAYAAENGIDLFDRDEIRRRLESMDAAQLRELLEADGPPTPT